MAQEPAELTLRYRLTNSMIDSDTIHNFFIDVAADLSKINRRLYKQGRVYYIQGITLYNTDSEGSPDNSTFKFSTIPNTWVTHNAWTKGKALWDKMNRQVLKDNPSLKSKWHDFKVLMNAHHHTALIAGMSPATVAQAVSVGFVGTDQLVPESAFAVDGSSQTGVAASFGEWMYSRYTFPEAANLDSDSTANASGGGNAYVHMLGEEFYSTPESSVGLIEGYMHTRAQIGQAGEPPIDGDAHSSWMIGLFDDGENLEDIIDVMEDANDIPPYDADRYPGSTLFLAEGAPQGVLASGAGIGVRTSMPGFAAPCGLICVTTENANSDSDYELYVKLAPGNYRGVASTPMGQ